MYFDARYLCLILCLIGFSYSQVVAAENAAKTTPKQPTELILATDGISLFEMQNARRHGLFKDFHPPTAMVSTFPSMSDIAWADIFDTPPPPGVNQLHFNPLQNRTIGTVLSDLNSQRDFEQRFQVSHADPIHHTRAYIDYAETARQELRAIERSFLRAKGKGPFFAYTPTSDVFMHSSFESLAYLRELDQYLTNLQKKYLEKTGRALRLTMLSDHGNNRDNGKTFDVQKLVADAGYNVTFSLRGNRDVVNPKVGVINYGALFIRPKFRKDLAELMARQDGVDLVVYRDNSFRIFVLKAADAKAPLEIAEIVGNKQYVQLINHIGDPLNYNELMQQMKQQKLLSESGMANYEEWFQASLGAQYPYAPVRIWRAYNGETMQFPPDIFLSLKSGWSVINPVISRLRKVEEMHGGTHGSLARDETIGYLMSNHTPSTALPSHLVRERFIKAQLPSKQMATSADVMEEIWNAINIESAEVDSSPAK